VFQGRRRKERRPISLSGLFSVFLGGDVWASGSSLWASDFRYSLAHCLVSKKVSVEHCLHDVILGKDFLERFKTIIDLEHHTISLHHEFAFSKHPLPADDHHPVKPLLCSVHALKTYVLPPNSETLVCGKFKCSRSARNCGNYGPKG